LRGPFFRLFSENALEHPRQHPLFYTSLPGAFDTRARVEKSG
jgi:hypothetical protein